MNVNVASTANAKVIYLYFHLKICQTVANSGTGLKQLCLLLLHLLYLLLRLHHLRLLFLLNPDPVHLQLPLPGPPAGVPSADRPAGACPSSPPSQQQCDLSSPATRRQLAGRRPAGGAGGHGASPPAPRPHLQQGALPHCPPPPLPPLPEPGRSSLQQLPVRGAGLAESLRSSLGSLSLSSSCFCCRSAQGLCSLPDGAGGHLHTTARVQSLEQNSISHLTSQNLSGRHEILMRIA